MVSDIIRIDNRGIGFREAVNETKKAAEYRGIDRKASLQLQLITEEMLSLARSVTGEMQASFWLENDGNRFEMHLTTKTVIDKEPQCVYNGRKRMFIRKWSNENHLHGGRQHGIRAERDRGLPVHGSAAGQRIRAVRH